MATRITSGPARILDSGQVTAFGGHGLSLELPLDDEGHVAIVELSFASDAEDPDVRVDSQPVHGGWHLHCVNFDRDQGKGSSVPVLLGGIGNDAIYFHFRVFKWGRTEDRTVHYTFYRVPGAIADDGDEK